MESNGGGVAAAAAAVITTQRLTSQHSTLRDTFLATDLAEALILSTTTTTNSTTTTTNPTTTTTPPRRQPVSNLTLGAVLNSDKRSSSPPPANVVVRTLLEIIRNEEALSTSGSSSPHSRSPRKTWKSFRERLKLKRNSNLSQNRNPNSQQQQRWVSSSVPQSDVRPNSRGTVMIQKVDDRVHPPAADEVALRREVDNGGSPRNGGSFRLSAALAAEREETRRRLVEIEMEEGNDGNEGDRDEYEDGLPTFEVEEANQPMRMSLMDLLEETDRQAGISGPIYRLDDEDEEEEMEDALEEEEGGGGEKGGQYSCCVCMVRHKGSAFIPCGHTFCRLCSRELWVQRGNCPLCNNFILEILDIF